MGDERELTEIRRFWEHAASQELDGDGLRPTARDPYLQEILETVLERHIWPGARLLDIGCGDGMTTQRLARRARFVVGVDYIEEFITRASARSGENCRFVRGDALELGPITRSYGSFDIVVSIRCLINLGSWTNQAKALAQVAACLEPGGLLLISEGWSEGLAGLNLRRQRTGLPAINTASYNLLIDRGQFESEARQYFEIEDYHCLGPYLFVSRVLQPLLVAPMPPKHDHPLNAVASVVQQRGAVTGEFVDCDYAGAYVMRRRA